MSLKRLREKKNNKKKKNKNFTSKTQYLNLKAPNNNVKLQSDKTPIIQISFFPNYTSDGIFLLMSLGNKSTRRNNEMKFKNQSTIFKPNNFKSLENS